MPDSDKSVRRRGGGDSRFLLLPTSFAADSASWELRLRTVCWRQPPNGTSPPGPDALQRLSPHRYY